jgi:hypothetical protein
MLPSNAKPKGKSQLPPPSAQDIEQFKKDFQAKNGFWPREHEIGAWKALRHEKPFRQSQNAQSRSRRKQ